MDKKRVVVTGIGAVTPIGNNMEENWEAIKNSVCGINHITKFDTTDYRTKVDAEVKNLNFEECGCKAEVDPRMAALLQLLDE